MRACVPPFLPDKVCVFLVSNSQTGLEAFLNPSPQAFELPGSVPMAGAGWGAPREKLALFLSFLSLLLTSVSPAPSCHRPPPQLGCLLSIQKTQGRGEAAGEPEALCNYRAFPHKS